MSILNLEAISSQYFTEKMKSDSLQDFELIRSLESDFNNEIAITTPLPFNKYDIVYLNDDVPNESVESFNSKNYYVFTNYNKLASVGFEHTNNFDVFINIPFHIISSRVTKVTDTLIINRELNRYFQKKWGIPYIVPVVI